MNTLKIIWKPWWETTKSGKLYAVDPDMVNYDFSLLQRIQMMPEGKRISFAEARIIQGKESGRLFRDGSVPSEEYQSHIDGGWVSYLVKKGYKIILDHTEYDILEEDPV